jgi:hypothetical protein
VEQCRSGIRSPAQAWPQLQPDLRPRRNRQYLYANLIVQYAWLNVQIGDYTEAEMRNNLRYLFDSPLMQEYWAATQANRARFLVPGTPEFAFNEVANEVFLESGGVPNRGWKPSVSHPRDDQAA